MSWVVPNTTLEPSSLYDPAFQRFPPMKHVISLSDIANEDAIVALGRKIDKVFAPRMKVHVQITCNANDDITLLQWVHVSNGHDLAHKIVTMNIRENLIPDNFGAACRDLLGDDAWDHCMEREMAKVDYTIEVRPVLI